MSAYMPEAKSVEWYTPPEIFDPLQKRFQLNMDVCARDNDASRCGFFWSPEDDGLKQDWTGWRCWMNPPYGRGIDKWVAKASNHDVIALLPARVDTAWYHDFIYQKVGHLFLRGRVSFINGDTGAKMAAAPFPCMIVKFGFEGRTLLLD